MVVYVNKVYLEEDFISYLQIIIHDEVNLKNIYYTESYNKVVEYCRDLKNKGHQVIPLLKDYFTIDPSVNKIRVTKDTKVETGFKEENFTDTVYSLYSTLSRCNAVLLSEEYPYEDGYVGLVSEFRNIEISTKNMEVVLPIIYGDKKVSEFKLISQEGEIIYNNKFKVAVPVKSVDKVYKYNLSEVGTVRLNNLDFVVFEYLKNLTIFRVLEFDEVPEPIIVRYANQYEFYYKASSLIKRVLGSYNVGSFNPSDKAKLSFSDLFNDYSGVFLRINPDINKSDLEKLCNLVLQIGPSIIGNKELNNENLSKAISMTLKDNGLPVNYTRLMLVALNIYRLSENDLDVMNSLMVNYSSIKLILLDLELYLYNLRLNIYNSCKTLYPNKSVVELKSYNKLIRMEVWRK